MRGTLDYECNKIQSIYLTPFPIVIYVLKSDKSSQSGCESSCVGVSIRGNPLLLPHTFRGCQSWVMPASVLAKELLFQNWMSPCKQCSPTANQHLYLTLKRKITSGNWTNIDILINILPICLVSKIIFSNLINVSCVFEATVMTTRCRM